MIRTRHRHAQIALEVGDLVQSQQVGAADEHRIAFRRLRAMPEHALRHDFRGDVPDLHGIRTAKRVVAVYGDAAKFQEFDFLRVNIVRVGRQHEYALRL